jgi:hypothetical protein|tara:strand:- start:1248 stop:1418 length:171 start_codon:yes stop_codon:yes gene_type:complete
MEITIAEFRANYDEYMRRMAEGEVFAITDIEQNADSLYEPLEDNRAIPIDIERASF